MTDTIPGLKVHEHEGKFAGSFELPPADLANVTYDGRTMLVVVADVGAPLRITQDKDGINKVHWTFDVADVAIVRDEGMRDHLTKSLHLYSEGVDSHPLDAADDEAIEAQSASRPLGMIGLYDKEGTFLGFKREDEVREATISVKEPVYSPTVVAEPEVIEARGSEEPPRREPEPEPAPGPGPDVDEPIYVPPELARPIPIRDPVLAKSLERGING